MLLSPAISLKRLADIQLDMSASQAEKQTCLSEEERMMEKYTSVGTVEDKRKCGTEKGVEWIRGERQEEGTGGNPGELAKRDSSEGTGRPQKCDLSGQTVRVERSWKGQRVAAAVSRF